MSSPFQKAFMGKNPMKKEKSITLTPEDLKDPKSASSAPAPSIGTEGQGGTDYELPSSILDNPEGQGGVDYEADDYKKKTESVAQMNSPLNSYASGGRGEIYVSSVGAIQQAVGAVQGAINSYTNETAEHKADRLAGRVESRKNRLSHKDEEDKNSEYYKKTERITARAADSKSEARSNQQTEIERLKKENEAYRNKYKA